MFVLFLLHSLKYLGRTWYLLCVLIRPFKQRLHLDYDGCHCCVVLLINHIRRVPYVRMLTKCGWKKYRMKQHENPCGICCLQILFMQHVDWKATLRFSESSIRKNHFSSKKTIAQDLPKPKNWEVAHTKLCLEFGDDNLVRFDNSWQIDGSIFSFFF